LRKWIVFGVVAMAAIGLAVGLIVATSGSTRRSNSTAPSTSSLPAKIPPLTVPHQEEAAVAACVSDAKVLEVALEAYKASKGSFPSPPDPWSVASYANNYAPLTGSSTGGPWMHSPFTTTNYVIEYDSAGHVWVAPPGSYEATYNPGQSFDRNPGGVCGAAAG
jgi:hypothetical protein